MGAIGANDSTGFTSTTSTQSNVKYQLKAFYKVTARTSSTVTFDIDIQVHYPDQWSSNGAWVRFDGVDRSCNPNHVSGKYDWYASSQSNSRSSYWQSAQISVSSSATTATISVGFSNTAWGEGTYHHQNLTIDFPSGWTNVGKPPKPTSTASWNETSVTFNWGAAANGSNNAVKGYTWYLSIYRPSEGTWVKLGEAYTTSRTVTRNVSSDERGSHYDLKVKAHGTQGDVSAYGPNSDPDPRRNYAPATPVVQTIGGVAPANGMTVAANASLITNASGDSGGYASGYTAVKRAAYCGSSNTGWQSSTTLNPPWSSYVGQTVNVNTRAYDGFVASAYSTTYSVNVGKDISANVPTFSTSILNSNTALVVPPAKVDGYTPKISYKQTIEYSWDNTDWETYTTTTISANVTASTTYSYIMRELYLRDPSDFIGTGTKTLYIRTYYDIGHLAEYGSTVSIPYHHPGIVALIDKADNSTTFKFPMDNTIPVTEMNAHFSITISNWTSGNSGVVRIQGKDPASSSWITIASASFSANFTYNYTYDFNANSNLRIPQGSVILTQVTIEVSGSTPIVVHTGNTVWAVSSGQNPNDINRIENRRSPVIAATDLGNYDPYDDYADVTIALMTEYEQLSFIRNDDSTHSIELPYVIDWDITKAFTITETKLNLETGSIVDTATPILLFNTLEEPMEFIDSSIQASSAISPTNPLTWALTSGIVTDISIPITGISIANNSNIEIGRMIVVKETFRSGPTDQAPNASLMSNRSGSYEHFYLANTHCEPKFNTGVIEYDRVLS